ncbi:MAG: hypothetical protein R3C59_30165 [Planctomycetaceae bacterium]
MSETTFGRTPPQQIRQQTYRHCGCVIVHDSGDHAGLLELEISLPEIMTAEEADLNAQLMISTEAMPLSPIQTRGDDGHFRFLFYSLSIAEFGGIPFEAMLCWSIDGVRHQRGLMLMPVEFVRTPPSTRFERRLPMDRELSIGSSLVLLGGIIGALSLLL